MSGALAAPTPLDPAAIDKVLHTVAEHLAAMNPGTIMSAGALHSEVHLAVWEHHGIYNNTRVGRDINRVLGAVSHCPSPGQGASSRCVSA